MSLADDFRRAIDALYDAASVLATYTDKDGGVSIVRVMLDRDLSTYGDNVEVSKGTATISVRASEMPEPPRRGETFLVDGSTYRVVSTLTSDELEHASLVA